jgi:hypothetical protein
VTLFARLCAGVELVWGRSGDCQSQIVGAPLSVMRFVIAGKGEICDACVVEPEAAVLNAVCSEGGCDGVETGKWVRGDGVRREEPAASQMNMKYPFRYKCVCVVL